jgi:hypothetical protein
MQRLTKFIPAAVILLALTVTASAQRQYQGSYQSVRQLIARLDDRTSTLSQIVAQGTYNSGRVDDSNQQRYQIRLVQDFENSVSRLRTNFEQRRESTSDVQDVLNRATQIDNVLNRNRFNNSAQNTWASITSDLSELAQAYRLTWTTARNQYPYPDNRYPNDQYPSDNRYPSRINRLTGTYRLDPSRSDDPTVAADRATRGLPYSQRQRIRDRLIARLESPDQIAIERRGRNITVASSRAPQITFDADGTERIEQTANGRTIRARATLVGDQLTVTSSGDRSNEFSVTFDPVDNGQRLNVTRRVYVDDLSNSITVQSSYNRVADVARFDIYNGPQNYPSGPTDDFIVRDGETVVGELSDLLSTETAHEGDRFTMTLREPSRLAGATLEGHVTSIQRSGRLTGRAEMTLDFDTMRTSDGRSYRFAGLLESVRTPNGDVVRVDNEGAVRDDSQTSKTAQRAAIGTAVGAIIGAIAGGGKGAAIGAIIGAGGGAGSVYIQGKNDLELPRGTEVTVRASAPSNR